MDRRVIQEIITRAKELHEKVVEWRRDFHRHPELAYEEVRTSGIVKGILKSLGYKIQEVAVTGVVGSLGSGKPVVALRADMDALPIQEENEAPYRSQVPGKMHACGHDAHTAMLLGAAHVIKELHDEGLIKGTTKLIFQPAEEGGLGAKKVVESGAVDDVDAFFGIHVWASLKTGLIGVREGPLLASADAFRVVVKGKGGHAAHPELAIDPVVIASDLVNLYQRIVSREVGALNPAVITVASIKAGTTTNVIPEEAELLGTVRTFDEKVRDFIISRLQEVTSKHAEALRGSAKFELTEEPIPPTVNDPDLAKWAKPLLKYVGEVVARKGLWGLRTSHSTLERNQASSLSWA